MFLSIDGMSPISKEKAENLFLKIESGDLEVSTFDVLMKTGEVFSIHVSKDIDDPMIFENDIFLPTIDF